MDIIGPSPWSSGRKWIFQTCPWNSDHTNRSAYIIEHSSGAIAAGCHHNGCADKQWHDLREILEPGYKERRTATDEHRETQQPKSEKSNPWAKAQSAPDFCAEEDKDITGLAKDLIVPGAITCIAAPRGIGKTLVAHAVAVAMAKGRYFRGEKIEPLKVLLVDRDNPKSVVRQRVRGWGGGHVDATNLKVLTREVAPDLKDKSAWEAFPVKDYDVVMVDSIGSFTEGITEKEGKETTLVLATVLDLIHKGPAVLLLSNCTKDALNTRGRGEWQDRIDIQYEVRDATGFTPSGKKDWWTELPEAGEAAWADRAARRKSRIDYRLAFVPSKFRLGAQPDPFCLQVNLFLTKHGRWKMSPKT